MVTVISLDRCLSIVCPMQMVQNQKITLIMLYVVWVIAAIASIPQAVIFSVFRLPWAPECESDFGMADPEFAQCVDYTVTYPGSTEAQILKNVYYPMTKVIHFLLPFATTMFCYSAFKNFGPAPKFGRF